jgi:adenylosuccinate synthase
MATSNVDSRVRDMLYTAGWFRANGAYVLVDGQYGSTGKGVAASLLAAYSVEVNEKIDTVTSNAGPNSGHTAILADGTTWVNKQIPIVTSVLDHLGKPAELTYLNGGAVIDVEGLIQEWRKLSPEGQKRVLVHPHAAVVRDEDRDANKSMVREVASTGKGTGPAAAARILRNGHVYSHLLPLDDIPAAAPVSNPVNAQNRVVMVETSQGFSLGINSGFYPYCTHRECTVAQALADARISATDLQQVMMVVRTYPIRVGNTQGSSGGHYPDQEETTWDAIGQTPEYTTVTRRMRRVFTWSRIQFREALQVNRPTVVMLNFANYLKRPELEILLASMEEDIAQVYRLSFSNRPSILLGFGPSTSDVVVL